MGSHLSLQQIHRKANSFIFSEFICKNHVSGGPPHLSRFKGNECHTLSLPRMILLPCSVPPSWRGKASTPKATRLGNDGRGHSGSPSPHFPVVGGRM